MASPQQGNPITVPPTPKPLHIYQRPKGVRQLIKNLTNHMATTVKCVATEHAAKEQQYPQTVNQQSSDASSPYIETAA